MYEIHPLNSTEDVTNLVTKCSETNTQAWGTNLHPHEIHCTASSYNASINLPAFFRHILWIYLYCSCSLCWSCHRYQGYESGSVALLVYYAHIPICTIIILLLFFFFLQIVNIFCVWEVKSPSSGSDLWSINLIITWWVWTIFFLPNPLHRVDMDKIGGSNIR